MLAFPARGVDGAAPLSFARLSGVDGREYAFDDFDGARLLVVVFMGNGCPILKNYDERLVGLQRRYGPSGVQLIGVNSNNSFLSPFDTLDEMVARATKGRFNFPYLKDEERSWAERFGAVCTPHVFVLDEDRSPRYTGRIDDAWRPDRVTTSYVGAALDDLLDERPVRIPETAPLGCGIVW